MKFGKFKIYQRRFIIIIIIIIIMISDRAEAEACYARAIGVIFL
jgi:hypothetical protein